MLAAGDDTCGRHRRQAEGRHTRHIRQTYRRQAGGDTAKASFGGRPASRRTASSTLRRNDPDCTLGVLEPAL